MRRLKEVDTYIIKNEAWTSELELLRETILQIGMEECFKWSAPVYAHYKKNVVGLGAFKNHFCIWFFNGSLLKDENKRLYNAQEGKTTAMRQWRFQNLDEVASHVEEIEAYLKEAMKNTSIGKVVKPRVNKPLIIPIELEEEFKTDKGLKTAFDGLNLTKKREYVAHIDSAKREKTKLDRLAKIIPAILDGKGLNDKYRK